MIFYIGLCGEYFRCSEDAIFFNDNFTRKGFAKFKDLICSRGHKEIVGPIVVSLFFYFEVPLQEDFAIYLIIYNLEVCLHW